MTRRTAARLDHHPPPARLAPVGSPVPFFVPNLPCGCNGGQVLVTDNSRATWYSEGPDVLASCPECGGYGYHELRGIANGPRWATFYPDLALRGGYLCARVTDNSENPIRLAWAPTLEDAKAWTRVDDWTPTRLQDGALLACLGLALGGAR